MPAPDSNRPELQPYRDYYAQYASRFEHYKRKNYYYYSCIQAFLQSIVPPGQKVLEIGSGSGALLHALHPSQGVGLNLADTLTQAARTNYPGLDFITTDVDEVRVPQGFVPDYVILTNMLDVTYDIGDFLGHLRPLITDQTLLIITSSNPLWAPLLRMAGRLRMRIPDSPRNYITNRDIRNVLHVEGFDAFQEGFFLPVPRKIPLISDFLNFVIPEIPGLRYVSSVQYILSRPRRERPSLSCSVIIPCHNEADNIQECIRRVPSMGAGTETLVVNDGSTDNTVEQVRQMMASHPHLRLLTTDKNQGKANAVRAGFENAKGDVVMILDADMTVPPEDLPKFLKPLQNGTADFVNGTRLVYPMAGKAMKFANYLGNKAFCFLASWVLRQRVSDTLCGTKVLFRRYVPVIDHAQKERWGDFELLFGAARLKMRILEVPVHYQERRLGKSKMRVIYDGFLFLWACIHGWFQLRLHNPRVWQEMHPPLTGWRELRLHPNRSNTE